MNVENHLRQNCYLESLSVLKPKTNRTNMKSVKLVSKFCNMDQKQKNENLRKNFVFRNIKNSNRIIFVFSARIFSALFSETLQFQIRTNI